MNSKSISSPECPIVLAGPPELYAKTNPMPIKKTATIDKCHASFFWMLIVTIFCVGLREFGFIYVLDFGCCPEFELLMRIFIKLFLLYVG